MNVYFFGNIDENQDNMPLKYLPNLKNDFPNINLIEIKPNEDVDFENESNVYLVDTMSGIEDIKILDESFIDNIAKTTSSSVHDYDLGFQLKYLKKLGRIKKVSILAIPMNTKQNYSFFHSIFKKFVEQDIQGS